MISRCGHPRAGLAGSVKPPLGREGAGTEVREGKFAALGVVAQPILVERQGSDLAANLPEAVEITLALPVPVDELDPELDRGRCLSQEFPFVDAEATVEQADLGDRGFAHADGSNGIRLDERHRDLIAHVF